MEPRVYRYGAQLALMKVSHSVLEMEAMAM